MSYHWRAHILMGLIILGLAMAGMYLIGANRTMQQALITSYEKYADLKATTTGVLIEGFGLADELRNTALANIEFKRKLEQQLRGGQDSDSHILVQERRKTLKRKAARNRKRQEAMGGP